MQQHQILAVLLFICEVSLGILSVDEFKIISFPNDDTVTHIAATTNGPIAAGTCDTDAFLENYDTFQQTTWTKLVTGSYIEQGARIELSIDGQTTYIGFTTNSTTVSINSTTISNPPYGSYDFIVQATGMMGSWTKRFGGPNTDILTSLAGANDGVFVCGFFYGDTDLGDGDVTGWNNTDMFIVKYTSSSGTVAWKNIYGGSGYESFVDVAVDKATSTMYAIGNFDSPMVSFGSGHNASKQGNKENAVVASFDPSSGAVNWITTGFGNDHVSAQSLAIGQGFIYVAGFGSNVTFGDKSTGGYVMDAFLFALNATGTPIWGIAVGGLGAEQGRDVAIVNNTLLMLGMFSEHFVQDGIPVNTTSGNTSAFISQHDFSDGSVQSISAISFNGLAFEPWSIIEEYYSKLPVIGGSIEGIGTINSQPVTTSSLDAVVLFLSITNAPNPSPSITPTPSTTPNYSPTATSTPFPSHSPSSTSAVSPAPTTSPSSSPSVTPSTVPSQVVISQSPTPSQEPADESSDVPVAVVAGSVAGGGTACGLIVVLGMVFWCRKKKKNLSDSESSLEDEVHDL